MLRLHHLSDPGNLTNNPLGLHAYIRSGGWEAARATNPWGARDCPSLDETIAAGHGFIDSWATGLFADGEAAVAGNYPKPWGGKVTCWPRGPGAFARFDEFRPGGLAEFIRSTRTRTDVCRKRGLDAGIYIGCPPASSITSATSYYTRTKTLKAWGKPIIDAGYTRVQLDAAAATSQINEVGKKERNAAMWFAEYLLEQGIAVDIETFERVTPALFDWFNGRFGIIASSHDWEKRSGAGWFNASCVGTNTRRFVWIPGSVPVQDRISIVNAAIDTTPVVEFGQLPESFWKAA